MKRSHREHLGHLLDVAPGGTQADSKKVDRLDAILAALAAEQDPPTTARGPDSAAQTHLADSLVGLQINELRAASRIVDVGAGAGFPGLALAVALPAASVDLVESSRRSCAVIERLIDAGGVRNARALAQRAESWAAGEGAEAYEVVTARAVAGLPVLVEYAAPLLVLGGALVAWKGRRDGEEERAGQEAASRLGMARKQVLRVAPFPEARDRHLHVYTKQAQTPSGFPRRPGRAAKRPLY